MVIVRVWMDALMLAHTLNQPPETEYHYRIYLYVYIRFEFKFNHQFITNESFFFSPRFFFHLTV